MTSNLKQDISDANALIAMMDTIENFTDLTIVEFTLRKDLRNHLTSLLKQQKVYLQRRGKIKWVTIGSENLEFFSLCGYCAT